MESKNFSLMKWVLFPINGTPPVINGLRKLRYHPSWLVIFVLVPSNRVLLFSKDLFTFIISFISLFVKVIAEPLIEEIPF